jgi:hypothetical protein
MHNNHLDHNSISGALLSVGSYILSINQVNILASFIFMIISGVASISTIYYNIKKIKDIDNEKP